MWKNKNGTSNRKCKCGSWEKHWMNFSETKWPDKCSVKGCTNKAELGAHVYEEGTPKEYIIPMCKECNQRTDEFDIKKGITPVDANKCNTCK